MRHFGGFQTMCANRKLPNFFQAKNAYSFDDYIVLHVTLAGIATALQAAAVPRFFAVGKTLTYLMEFYLTKFHESQQCR